MAHTGAMLTTSAIRADFDIWSAPSVTGVLEARHLVLQRPNLSLLFLDGLHEHPRIGLVHREHPIILVLVHHLGMNLLELLRDRALAWLASRLDDVVSDANFLQIAQDRAGIAN